MKQMRVWVGLPVDNRVVNDTEEVWEWERDWRFTYSSLRCFVFKF